VPRFKYSVGVTFQVLAVSRLGLVFSHGHGVTNNFSKRSSVSCLSTRL